ncbi:cytochrome P450 [Nocardioides deserti]|uniref:cytochrome P450 n=1 Tax=Nocardioides deserti TaxID=1588644 RepID=UPI001C92C51B|nr:cytochrome P450 [Nocardioides deserti]
MSHTNYMQARPALEHYALLDREREEGPLLINDAMPWEFTMVTRYDEVRAALQSTGFSCEVTNAMNVPRQIDIIPNMLDGEEHIKVRKVINPFFSPAAVKRMEPFALERVTALLDELQPAGSCDLVADFAIRYPTEIFLEQMGLPLTDADFFLPWVETVFGGLIGTEKEAAAAASAKIEEYFDATVEDRRAHPKDPELDLVSRLIEARIDEEPIPHQDILTICKTVMLAGLDTTRSALGYIYRHLALNPQHRQRIVDEPTVIPKAVEECLRMYPLVFQVGRLAAKDVDINGHRLDQGTITWLGIGSANRDPRKFEDPESYNPDRPGVNQHLAFGLGPHRCLGMHLARLELVLVLREWHKRIPEYRLREGVELMERGGQLSLTTLPLEWEMA